MTDREMVARINAVIDDLVILFGPLGGPDPEVSPVLLERDPKIMAEVLLYKGLNKVYKEHPEWFETVYEENA